MGRYQQIDVHHIKEIIEKILVEEIPPTRHEYGPVTVGYRTLKACRQVCIDLIELRKSQKP